MNRISLLVALFVVGVSVSVAPRVALANRQADVELSDAPSNKTVTLDVEGVKCASCTLAIRRALKNLDGVHDVRAGSNKSQVVVDYEPSKVTTAQLVAAVKKAGFKARARSRT